MNGWLRPLAGKVLPFSLFTKFKKNKLQSMSDSLSLHDFYLDRKVAVTGGASFISSHLVGLLVASGAKVTVIDDLTSGSLSHLTAVEKDIRFLEGDLRKQEFAESALHDHDCVFHLAAQHGGRGYIETHPVECVNNMLLDHTVYAAAVKGGARKIVFASSACVYPTNLQADSQSRLLLKESDANFEEPGKAFSDGEYGWAKLMGELQLRAFCKQHKIDGIACRIFTAYGERENESHAVVALIAKAVAKIDPYPIWGDGLQTRNFTYVQDTVTGMARACAKLTGFETINVGSSQHHTIMDLIECIFKHLGWRPREIKKELDKPVGVLSRAADNSKCRQVLEWEPRYTLEEGVARTIDWYVDTLTPERQARLEDLLLERV
ncbi:MAG: NAD-dependent epimerase/dehydratase family protein [Verrucomicrobiota bacterium]|nr:NAD-dependent epimerase/dehydratase family protein [Verrucomicrobiota bacterium]